jgi:hypothetical protein
MNNKIILIALLMSLATVTVGLSIQEQAQASSIVGNFADGYEEGKDAGANDAFDDNEHDSQCPPNDSLSWCAGYKTGYEAGYLSANTLQ